MDVHTSAAEALPPTDAELVTASVGGDRTKFEILVRRHNQRLYRACRAVLGDDAEAEDAVQTAWIAAFRHLATFRGDAAFTTWVTRIAVHEALARKKQQARLTIAAPEADVADHQSPERDAIAEEIGRLLEREVDTLPEGMRAVLVLRDVLELDTAETAAALGISDEAVRVRLHRARASLASSLIERGVPQLWRFDGARCDRITFAVLSAIA